VRFGLTRQPLRAQQQRVGVSVSARGLGSVVFTSVAFDVQALDPRVQSADVHPDFFGVSDLRRGIAIRRQHFQMRRSNSACLTWRLRRSASNPGLRFHR